MYLLQYELGSSRMSHFMNIFMSLSKAKSTNSIIPRNRRTDVNLQNLRSLCTGMVVNCTKSTNDDHAVHSECIPYFMHSLIRINNSYSIPANMVGGHRPYSDA